MEHAIHRFSDLFAQLGLPNDAASIAGFLATHRAASASVRLPDAPFWTPAQALFLRESLSQDAEWCGVVDQLSQALQRDRQPQSSTDAVLLEGSCCRGFAGAQTRALTPNIVDAAPSQSEF
jgi:hypothetical protein